jgi:hypothetical protein
MGNNVIGIIGGSGEYEISGLTNKRWQWIDSPFGEASDEFGACAHHRARRAQRQRDEQAGCGSRRRSKIAMTLLGRPSEPQLS